MRKVPGTFGDGRATRSRARRATINAVKLDLMTKRAKQRQPTEIPVTPLNKRSIKIRTEVLELLIHEAEIPQLVPRRLVKVASSPEKAPVHPSHSSGEKNQERPIDASPPTSPIPAIDLELLFSSDGDSRMGEMGKLLSALKSWGLFQVMGGGRMVKDEIKHPRQAAVEAEHMGVEQLAVGHGIPTSLIDDVGKVSREYFDLPKEEKEIFSKAVYKDGDEKDEIASEDEIRDWCDHLYLLVLPEDERDISLWPENPCKLRY
ncbi:iron ascorbate-dependent oxidoreductase [Asimina triloba]